MLDYAGHTRAFARLRPGLEYFCQDRMALRQKRYDEAAALIGRWRESPFLQQLIEIIEQANNEPSETKTEL
jgi:hypothetical protein